MKTDTAVFASMSIAKYFNFAPEGGSRGDPFLIQTSVTGNIIAGNRARALRANKGKDGATERLIKRTIPLAEDDMSKARACEEMIQYERPESSTVAAVNTTSTASRRDLS